MPSVRAVAALLQEIRARRREQWLSPAELHALRAHRLRRLAAAAARTRYWSSVFAQAALSPASLDEDTLQRLPLLDKATVQDRTPDLLTRPRTQLFVVRTSGSSGRPAEFFRTERDQSEVSALHGRTAEAFGGGGSDRGHYRNEITSGVHGSALMGPIEGRSRHLIRTPGGRTLNPAGIGASFRKEHGVRRWQMRHTAPDSLLILVVTESPWPAGGRAHCQSPRQSAARRDADGVEGSRRHSSDFGRQVPGNSSAAGGFDTAPKLALPARLASCQSVRPTQSHPRQHSKNLQSGSP